MAGAIVDEQLEIQRCRFDSLPCEMGKLELIDDAALGTAGLQQQPLGAVKAVGDAIERLVDKYIEKRESPDEPFIAAFRRLGEAPFKEALYGHA